MDDKETVNNDHEMNETKEIGENDIQVHEVEDEIICIVQPEEVTTQRASPMLIVTKSTVDQAGFNGSTTDRPKLEGDGKQKQRTHKRVELCMADKLRVIAAGATGLSQRQVAKKFGISKTQVQTLMKRKEEMMRRYYEGCEGQRKRAKFSKNNFRDVNERVSKWYLENSNDKTITGPMLKTKAIEISQELGFGGDFKASNGWLECLKKRYNIQIGRKMKSEMQQGYLDTATMVDMCPNPEIDTAAASSFQTQEGSDIGAFSDQTFTQYQTESKTSQCDPKIHSVFSMQGQHPIVQEVHPVPLKSPQMPTYRQFPMPTVTELPQLAPTPATASSIGTTSQFFEHNRHENTIQQQVKTFADALKCAAALKGFAVERGSVTLIGLMTAMEHELEREKRTSLHHDKQ